MQIVLKQDSVEDFGRTNKRRASNQNLHTQTHTAPSHINVWHVSDLQGVKGERTRKGYVTLGRFSLILGL